MKKNKIAILLLLMALFFAACSEEKKVPEVTSTPVEKNTVSTKKDTVKRLEAPRGIRHHVLRDESQIEWTAKKVTGQHNGIVKLGRGEIFMENGVLTGGNFAIDMQTIQVLDIKDSASNVKLTNHLKSDDFFSVAKNPIGRLYFSSVTPVNDEKGNNALIKGTVELKNIKKEVTFPAKVTVGADGKVTASADITLDRTLWDIKFRSGKFFENLGDNLISDDFNLKIYFTAVSK